MAACSQVRNPQNADIINSRKLAYWDSTADLDTSARLQFNNSSQQTLQTKRSMDLLVWESVLGHGLIFSARCSLNEENYAYSSECLRAVAHRALLW